MIKKRLITIISISAMSISVLLSACSGNQNNSTGTEASSSTVTQTTNSTDSSSSTDKEITDDLNNQDNSTPSDMPDGNAGSGMGAPPDGGTPPDGAGAPPNGGTPPDGTEAPTDGEVPPNGPGGKSDGTSTSTSTVTGTATYLQNGDSVSKSNETITASEENESAVKVTDGGTLDMSDSKISTTGDSSSMDDSSFYGLNAAVLAESGSKITISNTTIDTSGSGANGAFACGEGSVIELIDVTINCNATGAHGVDATVKGTVIMNNVDITTAGDGASAAIATDRGSGTITAEGGVITTTGTKSPGIYSTGDITVGDATITAENSEAVVIEGSNSATVNNCIIKTLKNWGVFIYQSFSGDAETGTGTFTMNGGTITAAEGPMFYSTNTDTVINLNNATVNAESGILLEAGADQWGTEGENGSTVVLNADTENLEGDVVLDTISTAELNLANNTTLKGTINSDNTAKSVVINLDGTSTWNVTETSYVTGITDEDSTLSNIISNGNTIYYDASNSANSWLNGKTISLSDGGQLVPITE